MDEAHQDACAKAKELQRAWYGRPLGEIFKDLLHDLRLNQVRLAGVLGLSAPMLSQLMSGQRAKIGNPVVMQRLSALQALASQAAKGALGPAEVAQKMDEIKLLQDSAVLSARPRASADSVSGGVDAAAARRVVREVQGLLREVADARDLLAAAAVLKATHPQLAQFLAVYGAGRTDEALAHYLGHQHT
ncbi:DNA-binding protein [Streptomyces sp. N35]|uniref:DNA-binding protein n=1 Tax=Streptomyces sp. N35 TaxID=2795730 RepID=UPI0018F3E270|nr:DNA-binding protein [Streptomyces sp. N35]